MRKIIKAGLKIIGSIFALIGFGITILFVIGLFAPEDKNNPNKPTETIIGSNKFISGDILPLNDMASKQTINIPVRLFEYLLQAVKNSSGDSQKRERWSVIDLRDSKIIVSQEGIGSVFSFENNSATGHETDPSEIEDRRKNNKPIFIDFHTHPAFTGKFIAENGVVRASLYGLEFESEQVAELMNLRNAVFSYADLQNLEVYPDLIHSMLLGTDWGYIMVVNKNINRQYSGSEQYSSEYREKINELVIEFSKNLKSGKILNSDPIAYKMASFSYLKEFCSKMDCIIFSNNDPTSPVLTRQN